MGFPEGKPIIAPAARVTSGRFLLAEAGPMTLPAALVTALIIEGGAGPSGKARIETGCITCADTTGGLKTLGVPAMGPTDPVGGLPFDPPRGYDLYATPAACGKIYTGGNAEASIKIYDYREPTSLCAADIAAAVVVDETIDGVTTTHYGTAFGTK